MAAADRIPVAAVIVVYRDDPRLAACWAALAAQGGVAIAAVVVENAAAAPAPPLLPGGAITSLVRIRRPENPGFASAFNEGFAASGDAALVASVNPDCRLEPDALATAAAALASDAAAGAIAFRLTRPGGQLLDSAGVVVSGVLWRAHDRGRGEPAAGRFEQAAVVDAPCLAAAMLRRTAALDAADAAGDILDARYFAYQDDVDLGWRLRRRGWRVCFVPGARGEHDRGWPEGGRRAVPLQLRRFSLRNRWWTLAKNAPLTGFLIRLLPLLLFEGCLFAYLLLREPRVTRAFPAAVRGLPESLRRREFRAH